ncbi:alpha/beta hydrolase [Fulvivirgaceae bacterium PWU5]|uniref:Alpha/beta hydrolase n=1 Tax=Dawidia cretensis TaxID=2782350 RepID=A0AAP2GV11_9BACT|nr:epoxide hydrolase family protein [Dawidia cretensis]MBT1708267.1 alpha/beta hydrolase [Dawidia cretensis]
MNLSPYRFTIAIPGHALADLTRRLNNTRWPNDTQASYLKSLVAYWQTEYRWHNVEAVMNQYTHYRIPIAGTPIHFLYQKGTGPKPIPIILTHGWPGSFWDMQRMIGPLADPVAFGGHADDAFDVIVPSLPGHVFSGSAGIGIHSEKIDDLLPGLMNDILGYTQYQVHKSLATQYTVQRTDPQAWAYSLNDSPVGLLAWLTEGLQAGAQTNEHVITNTMLYWLTGTIASSMRYHLSNNSDERDSQFGYMKNPDAVVHDIRARFRALRD